MTTRATGTFDIDSWDQETYDDRLGATLAKAHVTKTFRGDIDGTSTTDVLLAMVTDDSAAYVGFERVTGRLHGQVGTFVMHHTATKSGGEGTLSWTVVPHSGTGELVGLHGSGEIVVDPDGKHTYTLDYAITSP